VCWKQPLVQIRAAQAERLVDVLIRACSVSIGGDGEAPSTRTRVILMPRFERSTRKSAAARPARRLPLSSSRPE
jgi:hypothetical protein